MNIQIIDFGYEYAPKRAHYNDAGADVYAPQRALVRAGRTVVVPLGLGLVLPDGYVGFIFPRSSLSSKGISCELPPIDSGYRGQIHAIITNHSSEDYQIQKGDRIGQLVIMPVVIAEYVVAGENSARERGAFGSTGR